MIVKNLIKDFKFTPKPEEFDFENAKKYDFYSLGYNKQKLEYIPDYSMLPIEYFYSHLKPKSNAVKIKSDKISNLAEYIKSIAFKLNMVPFEKVNVLFFSDIRFNYNYTWNTRNKYRILTLEQNNVNRYFLMEKECSSKDFFKFLDLHLILKDIKEEILKQEFNRNLEYTLPLKDYINKKIKI